MEDVLEFMEANEEVNFRYFLSPETELLPYYMYLDFGFGNTGVVIQRGMNDMKAAIEMGPGKSFDKVRNLTKHARLRERKVDSKVTQAFI